MILAALIVGAALLMQVPTSFRILGYPGLAILFFLAAALGGVALVVRILASDRTPPETFSVLSSQRSTEHGARSTEN